MTSQQKQSFVKWIVSIFITTASFLAAFFGLQSCNVTRTVTTQSHCIQRGDTSVFIQSKTIEVYDATQKL